MTDDYVANSGHFSSMCNAWRDRKLSMGLVGNVKGWNKNRLSAYSPTNVLNFYTLYKIACDELSKLEHAD